MTERLSQWFKTKKWTLVRIVLVLAVLLAILAAIFPFVGATKGEKWAVVAAALAVLTSVISAWTSQKTVEMEEAKQRPYPYPFIDGESRYQLLQLRVTNFGAQTARDIYLRWNTPITNSRGHKVSFSGNTDGPDIAILLPGHSIATDIGLAGQVFQSNGEMVYHGTIEFRDNDRKHSYPFVVSLEQYRETSLYDLEESRTQFELQKIPELLTSLVAAVDRLSGDSKSQ